MGSDEKYAVNISGSARIFVDDLARQVHVDDKADVVGFALGLLNQMQNYKDRDGYVTLLQGSNKVRIKVVP